VTLDAITQTAHEITRQHFKQPPTTRCNECLEPHPCFTYMVAERIVQLAADVAATHEKIRAHADLILGGSITGFGNLTTWAKFDREHAEAILGLLEPSEHTPEETT
jgi:hypothetical protein